MSKLDTNHVVNLDLVKDRVNSVIKFGLADVETSDFYLGLYNNGSRVFDKDYIVTLYIVKPNGTFRNIELEPKEGLKKYYCNLPDTLKNIPGEYVCQAIIFDNLTSEKKISKSKFKYSVDLDLASEMAGIIDEEEQESILTNILNRLLTLENPVEPYATQKHVDECVSTLTEEIDTIKVKDVDQDGRLVNIESKNTEQDKRLDAVESKNTEQDGRLNTLENKVDGIDEKIVDTIEPTLVNHGNRVDALENKDIVHESRMTDIESKNVEQDNRLTSIEGINTTQNNRLDALETKDIAHESRMTNIESKNTEQDNRLNIIESKDIEQDSRLDVAENRLDNIGNDITNTMQPIIDAHTSRLDAIEAVDVSQNTRLDAIEAKNQQQDDRLLDIEKVNNKQDIDIKCLYGASQTIDVTEEGNSIYLQNSNNGFTIVDEIKGNTLVNCNKEPDKEITLNGNINTQGYGNVTLTEGVDGGLVDVALEGNTMVNVCDQKDPVAITKSYTVETGNHVALQGEYDGKCRPVVNGNTLVNCIVDNSISECVITHTIGTSKFSPFYTLDQIVLKPSTTYTFIGKVNENTSSTGYIAMCIAHSRTVIAPPVNNITTPSKGDRIVFKFTTKDDFTGCDLSLYHQTYGFETDSTISITQMILEGDYTNKPIPEYFEGLQSSFEDKVVTQEMIDNGEEEAENLGKYKVEIAVTGKNKFKFKPYMRTENEASKLTINNNKYLFEKEHVTSYGNQMTIYVDELHLKNANYTLSYSDVRAYVNGEWSVDNLKIKFDKNYHISVIQNINNKWMPVEKVEFTNLQIEEGTQATSYEPYKEYTKTFYLNSPLLEGDTIEQQGDNVVHVHRSELRAYETDDELTLPTDMTNTLVAKATPRYEVISQNDTILCDSYVNGHLDVDSVVPIEKVEFGGVGMNLRYLYPSTEYTIQFEADNNGTINALALNDYDSITNLSINKGINKFNITTGDTVRSEYIWLSGIGFNASNIVVTEATDQDFGYFEGMKSVGECEDLEVVSSNSDGTLSNTQTLTHEPLRAVGDIKDKYVLIDGKWYIERNCGQVVLDGSDDENWISEDVDNGRSKYYIEKNDVFKTTDYTKIMKCDKLNVNKQHYTGYGISGYGNPQAYPNQNWIYIVTQIEDVDKLKQWLQSNPVTVVYQLAIPTYEPIDYNPFETYSDITHISNNSTIPCNMTIKNTGYNCLLKPSTTYTVSSNLGLNTVTTPTTLTEDCLRFYDTDTSDITKMKDVTILEGDYTTNGKPLPSHFSGIESAFEQEYDEEKGKYKVNVKVANEDKSKENNITFYINEPLRGIKDIKDKVYVKNDKVVVERKCGGYTFDGSDDENITFGTDMDDTYVNTIQFFIKDAIAGKAISEGICDKFNYEFINSDNEHYYTYDRQLIIFIAKSKLQTQDVAGFKQWLQQNPTTVVYQLAEPTYEEVEYNDVKLFIESFKNSTLFYNSNVPVTSKVWYSYSIPLVDTVAQTANISDQQDSMIIDMATQVAVMEMYLM